MGRKRGWSVFLWSLSVSFYLTLQFLLDVPFLELSVVSSNDSLCLLSTVACPKMPPCPLWFPLPVSTYVNSPFIQFPEVIPFEWAVACCDIASERAKDGRKGGSVKPWISSSF